MSIQSASNAFGSVNGVGKRADDTSFFFPGTNGKGVLLIHGLTGGPVEMRFVGKMLNRMGFTVSAPTLAGHCNGENALISTKYEDWIESLEGPLGRLRRDVDRVYTAGICVGGALGLMLAHLHRDAVEKSVIYSPTLHYDGWGTPVWQRFGPRLFNALVGFKALHRLRFEERPPFGIKDERMRRFLCEGASLKGILPYFPVIALYENYRMNALIKKTLPQITVPTLLLHAREDDVSHPRNARAIKRLHGGPCDLVYLEDSYHMIHVDKERDRVAELTGQFFGIPQSQQPALN